MGRNQPINKKALIYSLLAAQIAASYRIPICGRDPQVETLLVGALLEAMHTVSEQWTPTTERLPAPGKPGDLIYLWSRELGIRRGYLLTPAWWVFADQPGDIYPIEKVTHWRGPVRAPDGEGIE